MAAETRRGARASEAQFDDTHEETSAAPGRQSMIGDVGHTLEATVRKPPGWQELALDAALVGATVIEAVSPPVAVAGIALNRLIHATR